MLKEARVLIVEGDPFARNWMALLISRDWRTRVVGEIARISEIGAFYLDRKARKKELPTAILINDALLAPPAGAAQAAETISRSLDPLKGLPGSPSVIFLSDAPDALLLRALPFKGFCGYLLKREIGYSLGWALALASPDRWVTTPSTETFLARLLHEEPPAARDGAPASHLAVLDGQECIHGFSDHEAAVARLALIFSMERGEMSDEIKVTTEWAYGLVSSIYRKIGLEELLSGEVDPAEYLGDVFTQVPRFVETMRKMRDGKKKKAELETLAFHILTMPSIQEFRSAPPSSSSLEVSRMRTGMICSGSRPS